jgi:hypothetical protein
VKTDALVASDLLRGHAARDEAKDLVLTIGDPDE